MQLLREVGQSSRASPLFSVAVLLTLGLTGIIGLMLLLMQLQPGFLGMAHGTDPSHRTHELTFGFLFLVAVVGLLAQLRRPSRNVAGMSMALVPWVALLLAGVLAGDVFRVMVINPSIRVGIAVVIAALLHPAGRDYFRSFRVSRVNWLMLAMVVIAAVPLLVIASTNIRLQATVPDSHAALGHYGFMAAFAFTVIGVGLLASLRPVGWRLPEWVAGLLPVLLAVTSLVYPDNSSSLGLAWAVAALAWSIGFIAVAELTGFGGLAADDTDVPASRSSTASSPVWVRVLRAVALIPIVLIVVNAGALLTGLGGGVGPGGIGGHTPPGAAGGQGDFSPGVEAPDVNTPAGTPGGHTPPSWVPRH